MKSDRFSNRDLLVIAVLSGIGGVMSTYIGYLGNLLNNLLGVPFGAGQFVAGLHVFWLVLAAGLVGRPGAAALAGLLKGTVELLTGSTHGVAIVLVSLIQGAVLDVVLYVVGEGSLGYALGGGLAAASNVAVFQILYFSGAPWGYLLFISVLALISGVLFAGSFGRGVLDLIRVVQPTRLAAGRAPNKRSLALSAVLLVLFSAGALYYFSSVYQPPWAGPECRVEGAVESPISFQLSRFASQEKTISAELKGQVTYVAPQDYTGVPIKAILAEARPKEGAETVRVVATDGYEVPFPLADVLNDDDMILIQEDDTLRLIAANYAGGYWVRQVSRLVIE